MREKREVGASSLLQDLMRKKLMDLKYLYKLLLASNAKHPVDLRLLGQRTGHSACFNRLHLSDTLHFLLQTKGVPTEKALNQHLLRVLQSSIQWLYVKHVLDKRQGSDAAALDLGTELDRLLKAGTAEVCEETAAIMREMCVLLAIVNDWDEERINRLISIAESEDIHSKLIGLQKLIMPETKASFSVLAIQELLKTHNIICKRQSLDLSKVGNEVAKQMSGDLQWDIVECLLSVTQGTVGLLPGLPETFSALQLAYFSRQCPNCMQNIKEKYLCLFYLASIPPRDLVCVILNY